MLRETKARFVEKRILFTIVFTISANAIFAQPWMMNIKQGTGRTYSIPSEIDEITFINTTTTPFVCGNVILHGGETYQTVSIGSQCWFQKNLNIGIKIAGSSNQTDNSTIEKYCYDNLDANCTTYGGLYQWNEAMNYATIEGAQGICPEGWHIPTLANFETLVWFDNNGNNWKAVGQGTGGGAGLNTNGFSALLAGGRGLDTYFYYLADPDVDDHAFFWTSTVYGTIYAYWKSLECCFSSIYQGEYEQDFGFSVRCLMD